MFDILKEKVINLKSKIWRNLFFSGLIIVVLGFVGFLVPFGDGKWNFIFENLIWLPFELILVVFIFDRLMKRNNERIAAKREFDEYYLLAEKRLTDLINILKLEMIKVYAGVVPQTAEETNKKFESMFKDIEELIDPIKIKEGIHSAVFDYKNISLTPDFQRKTHLELSALAGEEIVFQIKGHFDLFLKYIPTEIFHKLDKILICVDQSMVFSENPNFKMMRNMLIYKDSEGKSSYEEYKGLSNSYESTFKEYYQLVIELEQQIVEKRA
ncbi:hypothetical protein IA806_02385 [Listeria seeligeri]|uniref:hypothetical protein n=1 Tax=Listeria seeligeri TaxID=1640 RepID=UPI0018890DD5|nr:hypothetical protein [Listeria seeligeri]MBF2345411.1 hypothetical protein [Listeria seeligeri]